MAIKIYQPEDMQYDDSDFHILDLLQNKYNVIKEISVMPDFHFKHRMEVPSSTTFAVNGHICLSLSSPEQNCGMTLVATPLSVEEISDTILDKIFNEIRTRIPLPPRKNSLIDNHMLIKIFNEGAEAVIDNSELNHGILDSIEHKGKVSIGEDIDKILTTIPRELIDIALITFCHIGDGNHFFEMQYVDEIINQNICDALGISKNQIFFMYHSGSGYFGSRLGRYYAHRMKNTKRMHLDLIPKKILFHLSTANNTRTIVDRIKYYLLWKYFIFIPTDTSEGERCLTSMNISTNFGYANRASILVKISEILNKELGVKYDQLSILWDHSHNSIQPEDIDGQKLWVHRHNTCRILPPVTSNSNFSRASFGQPMFIPGTNATSSYIGVSGNGCRDTINSVDHGAGNKIKYYIENGYSDILPGHYTKLYNYNTLKPTMKEQYTSQGIDDIISILKKNNIIKPIARLKPIAVLKG